MSVVPTTEIDQAQATRCAIVVDESLPPGLAANAAAVLALTLGATAPDLRGADFEDLDGQVHPGLIPQGLPVLRAPRSELAQLRAQALEAEIAVIDFPTFGQQTNDYEEFRARVATTPPAELDYLGILLRGTPRSVRKLTGSLALLR
jgi:hypothetical protein